MAKEADTLAQLMGARLRACREVAGLSQRALARRMGCLSHREVGGVERGYAMRRTVGLVAKVLGIAEAQLCDPDEDRWRVAFEAWQLEWQLHEQWMQLEARKAALLRELVVVVQCEAALAVGDHAAHPECVPEGTYAAVAAQG